MLSSLMKSVNLGKIITPSSSFSLIKSNFSNGKILNSDKSDDSKIILTENLPEIPPNYGFPGDENIRSIYEIKKINRSFQYGSPPRLKRRFIKGGLVIRLMPISSCSNRRFFRIAVTRENYDLSDGFIEDLGSYDPMPNRDNNILIALNVERIKYYLSKSTPLKGRVGEVLGLAGLLPVHPSSYLTAYRNRNKLESSNQEAKA
ncbi:unnamed protein product [Brachionus calyciflorus]|uniref:Small ribosomal subunit protein bS16m n=1 Tax=Brachionus calyciflorus TaxID=104777 RepID=A0A813RN97_9BILA|nr:unnamed protein product [Brachionus calyciflorus]